MYHHCETMARIHWEHIRLLKDHRKRLKKERILEKLRFFGLRERVEAPAAAAVWPKVKVSMGENSCFPTVVCTWVTWGCDWRYPGTLEKKIYIYPWG